MIYKPTTTKVPFLHVYNDVTSYTGSATEAVIQYDTISEDNMGGYDVSTYKYTVKESGLYYGTASVAWGKGGGGTSTYTSIRIRKETYYSDGTVQGAEFMDFGDYFAAKDSYPQAEDHTQNVSGLIRLVVGDIVYVSGEWYDKTGIVIKGEQTFLGMHYFTLLKVGE